jgi:hypothetical protein
MSLAHMLTLTLLITEPVCFHRRLRTLTTSNLSSTAQSCANTSLRCGFSALATMIALVMFSSSQWSQLSVVSRRVSIPLDSGPSRQPKTLSVDSRTEVRHTRNCAGVSHSAPGVRRQRTHLLREFRRGALDRR